MMIRSASVLALCLLALCLPAQAKDEKPQKDPKIQGLSWRCIGPARGGRVSSVSGVRGDSRTYYMGACGGGLWKTSDAGRSWRNTSDKFFKTGSVGAVAVAESDPNVVYVGMGEPDPRGNFSHGDGVYRSLDAGKTWEHAGLAATRQIGRIVVDPNDPNRVFVAALGHVYGPNKERGVYRSLDGGANWTLVHSIDADTGAIEISMDPHNSRVLYAGFWQVRRKPWRFDSGGKGSGLWRSRDGGETWEQLKKGLPKGVKGRIGVSASAAQRNLVYAIVEAEDGGVFRSTDGGDSWRRVNQQRDLRQRAWYYSRIQADPQEADVVYVLNVHFHRSADGGRSFKSIRVPHVDNHALWIDPDDNQRMIEGNDGGANISFDGGANWSRQDNQPTAQFYRVAVDNSFPYRVLGAQQDNSTVSIPHTSNAMNKRDFHPVGGGESGYIVSRPDDPNIVYAGSYAGWLTRYDHRTGLSRPISPWPENPIGGGAGVLKHRFQWTFPIVISPHDPQRLYVGGERIFLSTNGGQSWKAISEDLSTNDKEKQKSSGGPITQDNTTVEYHCTVFTIAESPLQKDRIWAGTDDGRVHVTDDAGGSWKDVTPKGLAKDALVSLVDASAHDPATAWLAVTRYKSDDFKPYVYRTRDRGESWDLVTKGLPDDSFVRSVREDPVRKDLLYAGTETGIWYSMHGGDLWQPLQLNLPVVPVTDLVTKDDDLVISTQGRSFWILAGLGRLRRWDRGMPVGPSLMPLAPANRSLGRSARVHFHMPAEIKGKASLTIYGPGDTRVRSFAIKLEGGQKKKPKKAETQKPDEAKSADPKNDEAPSEQKKSDKDARGKDAKDTDAKDTEAKGKEPEGEGGRRGRRRKKSAVIKAKPGMNLYVWDMRRDAPARVPGAVGWPNVRNGPRVLPGTYRVDLRVGKQTWSKTLEIEQDPRRPMSAAEIALAEDHVSAIRDTLDRVHKAVNRIRAIRAQVVDTRKRAKQAGLAKQLKKSAEALLEPLKEIEDALIQSKSKSAQDPLNYPVRLNDKLAMLMMQADRDPRPTQGQIEVRKSLLERIQPLLARFEATEKEGVPAFNAAVEAAKIPAIVLNDPAAKEDSK